MSDDCCSSSRPDQQDGTAAPPTHEYTMVGVRVQFPVKPYPSQMAVMAQILRGLQKQQNCLLESPTGSGKSLALLCSTLAWQRQHNERALQYNSLLDQGIHDPELLARLTGVKAATLTQSGGASAPVQPSVPQPSSAPPSAAVLPVSPAGVEQRACSDAIAQGDPADTTSAEETALEGGFLRDDEDKEDFKTPPPRVSAGLAGRPPTLAALPSLDDTLPGPGLTGPPDAPRLKKIKPSRIYYGSRTHKQIAQVIKELKRTAYSNVRTVVLGSRDHYCIHPVVSKGANKNEGCRDLRDHKAKSCSYYNGAARVKNHDHLRHLLGLQGAHDLETLVRTGRRGASCPYYLARQLAHTADIIFCPYNYLVDPLIRDAMMINLRHEVVVLDEAHNIEDCSREAASAYLQLDDLLEAKQDAEKLFEVTKGDQSAQTLSMFLSILCSWMERNARSLEENFDSSKNSKIYTGSQMIEIFNGLEIGKDQWKTIKMCLSDLSEENAADDVEELPKLRPPTVMLLKNLFLMYRFLYSRPVEVADDYRVALVKAQNKWKPPSPTKDGWLRRQRGNKRPVWTVALNFMCLNPAVAFAEVGCAARNVILTSGTLSPMASFQSELGVAFPIQLEANHVIDKKQVWVGTVSRGPNNLQLQATYQHTESTPFQDELGRSLLHVCRAVPRGVLCFLPSYALLDKLVRRWQSTGLWNALSELKVVTTEPRRSGEFERTLLSYYEAIEGTSDPELCSEGVNGALLLAVCRGKVSEGLDFTDDNARAVVAVGIPFPNVMDVQVKLKREYNNQHCHSRGLLSGGDWYEVQAYRALNQALGRCIRHRYDWGALLLVDSRYQSELRSGTQNKYIRGLSKWVRGQVVHHEYFSDALVGMTNFAQYMTEHPPKPLALLPPDVPPKALPPPDPRPSCPPGATAHPAVSGPVTSTQISDCGAADRDTDCLELPDLSQISAVADDAHEYKHQPALWECDASVLQHKPTLGSLVTDVTTPSTGLATLLRNKLVTESPISAGTSSSFQERKRKLEEPIARDMAPKKECTAVRRSSSCSLSTPGTQCYKFLSAKRIELLSPVKAAKALQFSPPVHPDNEEVALASPELFLSDPDDSYGERNGHYNGGIDSRDILQDSEQLAPVDSEQLAPADSALPLSCRPVLPKAPLDDSSDLDDFDLDRSIRRSPEIRRRTSGQPRRRGVVYSKWEGE